MKARKTHSLRLQKRKHSMVCYGLLLVGVSIINTGLAQQVEKPKQSQLNSSSEYWYDIPVELPQAVNGRAYTLKKIAPKGVLGISGAGGPILNIDVPSSAGYGDNYSNSENSIYINPNDKNKILTSSNTHRYPTVFPDQDPIQNIFGVDNAVSVDGGLTWTGVWSSLNPPAHNDDFGDDPSVVIGNNGWYYSNHMNNDNNPTDQMLSYSTNEGQTYTTVGIAANPHPPITTINLDKNHLWIDNRYNSQYEGNLYCAWSHNNQNNQDPRSWEIEFSRSADNGLTWSSPILISDDIAGTDFHQGVQLQTGPRGNVYACWSIFPQGGQETAIGFAKSTDGGQSFQTASSIQNVQGIRSLIPLGDLKIGVNSYPSMTVDISGGLNDGTIYIVWADLDQISGNDAVHIYMIKSTNEGSSWSTQQVINTISNVAGNISIFPAVAADPETGRLNVVYYSNENENDKKFYKVRLKSSVDGGSTWAEKVVSGQSFEPLPRNVPVVPPGTPYAGYFSHYIGIAARNDRVLPYWTESYNEGVNRQNHLYSYTASIDHLCTDDLYFRDRVYKNGRTITYQASDEIVAAGYNTIFSVQNTPGNPADVTMKSGNTIDLLPGVEVEYGALFYAYIGTCDAPQGQAGARTTEIKNKSKEKVSSVTVFPNPGKGVFHINLSDHEEPAIIRVYNVSGSLVKEIKVIENGQVSMDLTDQAKGVYFIKTQLNGETHAGKLIVE